MPNVDRIPPLVDVDAHIVEPPDVWSSRLPAKYRDIGPHIEYHPTGHPEAGRRHLHRGARHRGSRCRLVVLRGPPLLGEAPHRRRGLSRRRDQLLAASRSSRCAPAAGSSRTASPTWTLNHVQAQLCYPNYPRFAGQIFLYGKDTRARPAVRPGLQRLDGRGVVRRLRRPAGAAVPGAALGRRARRAGGPPQRRTRACAPSPSPSCPPTSACRASTRATGTRSSPRARRPARSCACTSARAPRPRRPRRDAPDAVAATHHLRQLARRAWPTSCSPACFVPLPEAEGALRRVPDRLDPLPARAFGRRLGHPPRLERLAG